MTDQAIGIMRYRHPDAYASVRGSAAYPEIQGMVWFYKFLEGTLVCAEVAGLPAGKAACAGNVFGFHLHEGNACSGTTAMPFADAKGHYNPGNCPHPAHAGDFPVLFGNHGYAWLAFYTERFQPAEILGRTVIIHENPDDYRTQPSGNAGAMIACGVVR